MEHTIKDLSEYLKITEVFSEKHGASWFRGIGDSGFELVPGIVWQGIPPPIESNITNAFLVSYKSYGDYSHFNPWEVYALMQHHGLPTRLLDWSRSPLVALYFALTNYKEGKGDCAVWCIDPHALNTKSLKDGAIYNPGSLQNREICEQTGLNLDSYLPGALEYTRKPLPEMPAAIEATHVFGRASAQKSCFTVHGSDTTSIDEIYINEYQSQRILKIIIEPSKGIENLKSSLFRLGFDEEFIGQDLDSLCKKILRESKDQVQKHNSVQQITSMLSKAGIPRNDA